MTRTGGTSPNVVASTKRAKIAHFIGRPTRQHKSGSIMGSTCSHTFQGTTPTVIKKGRNQLGSQGGGGATSPFAIPYVYLVYTDPLAMLSLLLVSLIMPIPPPPPDKSGIVKHSRNAIICISHIFTLSRVRGIQLALLPTLSNPSNETKWSTAIIFMIFTDLCPRLQFSRCPVLMVGIVDSLNWQLAPTGHAARS